MVNRGIAFAAKKTIENFWRYHKDSAKFQPVVIEINNITYALSSNMKNGFPPRR